MSNIMSNNTPQTSLFAPIPVPKRHKKRVFLTKEVLYH